MGLFNRKPKDQTITPGSTNERIVVALPTGGETQVSQVSNGHINLTKGWGITLTKSPVVTAKCSWPPATDYDVFALVLYRNGAVETVSTFGTQTNPTGVTSRTSDGAVTHTGDVGRSQETLASESIEVRMNQEIVAVVPVVYSAQSNGTGSFRQYQVGMTIDNGAGQTVQVDASQASSAPDIYSCVPGIILNGEAGVRIEAVEAYSRRGSEHRPSVEVQGGSLVLTMDAGPVNAYK